MGDASSFGLRRVLDAAPRGFSTSIRAGGSRNGKVFVAIPLVERGRLARDYVLPCRSRDSRARVLSCVLSASTSRLDNNINRVDNLYMYGVLVQVEI